MTGIELQKMLRLAGYVLQDFDLHDGPGLNPVYKRGCPPGPPRQNALIQRPSDDPRD